MEIAEFIKHLIEIILHVDKYLAIVIQHFGAGAYLVLFLIIFAETGLVVTPFLPGDSLLFAAGAFAALGSFKVLWLFTALAAASIIGDSVNYAVGKTLGEKAFGKEGSRVFKKEYLERTHRFFEKYGGKTIIIARFVPIVRTFAPFVAGVGKMTYGRFLLYNVTGGILWVGLFVGGGFYFGNAPVIKENFSLAILAIVFLSILPGIIEIWRHRRQKNKVQGAPGDTLSQP